MSGPPATPWDLEGLQRWMQAVLTHPQGVEAGAHSQAALAALSGGPENLERLIAPSKSMTSIQRLEIYHKAYYARLIECLAAEFPVLAQTVGEEVFAGFAFGYLQHYPSRSYTLARLGEHFTDYLRQTRPTREESFNASQNDISQSHPSPAAAEPRPSPPPPGRAADWADFLIELARVEWTFHEVFDGPGTEQSPTLDLSAVQAEISRSGEIRLAPHPSLRLLALQFPVNAYYTQARQEPPPPPPAAAETFLAVLRRGYVVRRYDLSRSQFHLLQQLLDGHTLADALAAAAPADETAFQEFSGQLAGWFQTWSAEGFFAGLKE